MTKQKKVSRKSGQPSDKLAWDKMRAEHRAAVAAMPQDIREAHDHCDHHRPDLEASAICGCFSCMAVFKPVEITIWIDEDANGCGQTALCPHCGIDSVIGDRSGFPITEEFLKRMNKAWF